MKSFSIQTGAFDAGNSSEQRKIYKISYALKFLTQDLSRDFLIQGQTDKKYRHLIAQQDMKCMWLLTLTQISTG